MKKKVSVIIPIYNERKALRELIDRLDTTFSTAHIPYELLFIDDHSSDGSFMYLSRIADGKIIQVYEKIGRKGKAFSLIEGFERATGSIIAMIDADLQYPPEAIPEMVSMLDSADIIVANRKKFEASRFRLLLSRVNKKVFGETLYGLNTDVQSGLKVFKQEVIDTIRITPSSPWTFDLEFLYKAKFAGYAIANYDITFLPRQFGKSNISVVKAVTEVGTNAISLKLTSLPPQIIQPKKSVSMIGAGIGYKEHQYITHTTLAPQHSAIFTFGKGQRLLIALVLGILISGLLFAAHATAETVIGVLSFVYLVDVFFNLYIIVKSLQFEKEITISEKETDALSDAQLPVYSILCPLYKEAHVIPQFLDAINKLDWPKQKLDVLLLLEQDDTESIEAVKHMILPPYVRTVVVPDSQPKTKPKACNYGLGFAKGEYLVIFDAEDMPDPLQLKKAYLGFKQVPDKVVCLQAKLNYYNPHQNLLTKFFTAEYSLWFDITLPGLQSLNTSLPLGGTSNHFRTDVLKRLRGWDPFNVTEDADLGVRLFKEGYQTAVIDSTTYEEANSRFKNWIRQRSRWIKGYMQTYLVHTRRSTRSTKHKQLHALYFHLTVGGKLAFILINPILWIVTISYFVFRPYIGSAIESLYPTPVLYMAVPSLVFGNFLFLYYYMIGCAKRGQWALMKYVFLIPIYWAMISVAGAIALYQLVFKPHYWEKTIHGLHLKQRKTKIGQNDTEISIEIEKPTFPRFPFGQTKKRKQQPTYHGKRILIFNWRDGKHVWSGGAEVYIHELSKRLVREGNSVTVFCGNDGKHPTREIVDGVEVIRRGGFFTVYVWAFVSYVFSLHGKYDVVLDCENGIPFFTPLFVRKPIYLVIFHIHQEVFRNHLLFPFSALAKFLEGVCMPRVYRGKTVLTISESTKQEIMKLAITGPENIYIIHPGVSLPTAVRTRKSTHPLLVYVGRLKHYKRVDTAIRAFAQLVPALPDAQFVIAGDGEYKKKLLRLVEKLHLTDHVTFIGKITEAEKQRLLASAWVSVQPSEIEGWGITVIEANAYGTPVVASRVGGLQDSVVDKKTGLLVTPNDPDAFAKAVKRLFSHNKLRNELGKNARVWAKQFSWDANASQLLDVISDASQMPASAIHSPELVIAPMSKV